MLPKLSIIVTGRNDDYGGDFGLRLQTSINWWSYFVKLYHIKTEYVFVNWNPLPGKASLYNSIKWSTNEFFDVKFVEVPFEVHHQFDKPSVRKSNQLYEFIAKNAGIRRATGEYILSTNADILCDPKIFEFIAKGNLRADTFYRADRYDFHKVEVGTGDSQLEAIRENVFDIRGFGATFPFRYSGNIEISILKFKIRNQLFLKWNLLKRKYDKLFTRLGCDIVYDNAEYQTHVAAAGDFMLMHRDRWQALKAYSENFYVTLHNDAELVFNAHASGLEMKVLFYPVYHQDHERRYSDVNPDLQREAYKVYKELQVKAQRLLRTHQPEISNHENWGLKNFDLETKHISYV